ncbi:hypothetical protein GH891_33385, partial [Bacillus thuringiensis]|nr:hypothetical protein [Bacillus thuringiensis]
EPKNLFSFPILRDMVQFVKKLDQFSSSQTNDVNIMNDNKAILLNVKDKQLNQHTLTKIQEKMPDIKIERIYPLAPFQEVIYEYATN